MFFLNIFELLIRTIFTNFNTSSLHCNWLYDAELKNLYNKCTWHFTTLRFVADQQRLSPWWETWKLAEGKKKNNVMK